LPFDTDAQMKRHLRLLKHLRAAHGAVNASKAVSCEIYAAAAAMKTSPMFSSDFSMQRAAAWAGGNTR